MLQSSMQIERKPMLSRVTSCVEQSGRLMNLVILKSSTIGAKRE
jgi:hypothetical protein